MYNAIGFLQAPINRHNEPTMPNSTPLLFVCGFLIAYSVGNVSV
ncbi:MAG: hypothetical protein ACK5C0_11945 [Candidatus Kapaibacterium sp.]|jgi:hypothetical protein